MRRRARVAAAACACSPPAPLPAQQPDRPAGPLTLLEAITLGRARA